MTLVAHLAKKDIDDGTLTSIRNAGRFACDIETSGLDPQKHEIGTVQVFAPGVGGIILQVRSEMPRNLCRLIEDATVQKIFHHALFDLRFMATHWHVTPRNIACTKIASKILRPNAENKCHSLQNLLSGRMGIYISKDQRLTDWLSPELTAEQVEYATADVRHLLSLFDGLEKELRAAGLDDLFNQCAAFIPSRVRLEVGGWPDVFAY